MTISHKRTFFENIECFDHRLLQREIQKLLAANEAENQRFDVNAYRRRLLEAYPVEVVDRILNAGMKAYTGSRRAPKAPIENGVRAARKQIKRNMKSRR